MYCILTLPNRYISFFYLVQWVAWLYVCNKFSLFHYKLSSFHIIRTDNNLSKKKFHKKKAIRCSFFLLFCNLDYRLERIFIFDSLLYLFFILFSLLYLIVLIFLFEWNWSTTFRRHFILGKICRIDILVIKNACEWILPKNRFGSQEF